MPETESLAQSPDSSSNLPLRSRKRSWPRTLLWSSCGLLALVLLGACVGVFWLHSAAKAALPVLDGDLHLAGLSAPVTVRRDVHGVPHIDAATQDDLFVAQGYVTAQDRLWQMDAFRRNANGELAEILGPTLVRHDKMQRNLLFRLTAQRIYASMSVADRARLDDYARGVNLFIAQHRDSLPPEFKLLFYRPQPWSGVDSVSVGLMMVETLDTHWYAKLARERIAARLRNPKLEADLYPVGSWRDHPPTGTVVDWSKPHPAPPATDDSDDEDDRTQAQAVPDSIPPLPDELRALLGLPACLGCAPGSNNWVIAGSHTASGKPLLSNDMHLGLTEPNIWFMADLRAPGFHSAGVTLPGMPFVIAGHNEHVAWGFTALYADVQDLYVENLDHKGNYEASDASWKPLAVDHEIIHVRGGKDVAFDVLSTEHGPLLNPIFTKGLEMDERSTEDRPLLNPIFARGQRPISLKWTLYDTTLNALPLYEMNTASNWAEFSAALSAWSWPTQNVVYSDDQGHIAYRAVGKVPIRSPAGPFGAPLQRDSMDLRLEWQGYIPFDQMPNAFDPPSGFLATANSRVTTGKSPYPLTLEWADPYRVERIYKSLEGRDQLTPKDMLAVQTDVYSEVDQELGHRFAYAIDHAAASDGRLRQAADLMRSWDGKLTTDSAAASIVTRTRSALWPLILEPKLGKDAAEYQWAESNFAEEEIVMHASPDWLPKSYKNWDELLTDAVRKGMKQGKAPVDVAAWSYGSWHVVDIEHPLAKLLPLVGRIAGVGPQALSGDTTTVKQAGTDFGPSQRFTMDWSNIDGSTENIVLGESGNPYSPYFRDQWNDYYGGTTFALPFTPAAVDAQTRHTLRLLP
jgi:penicillin amidase